MTAAMLVLEPIFEADLPSELYAYLAPGGTLSRRWSVGRGACCFAAIRTWWTPTSRTTTGAFPIPSF